MTFTLIHLLAILFFIFGTIIGSFLNVVICRLHTQKSLSGRSGCMSCRNQLCWYELIPLFSFLALRGRCRNCQSQISYIYPVVELLTGVLFAGLFLKFQYLFFASLPSFIAVYSYYAVIFSLLLVVTVYDFRHKVIPDILSFTVGFLSFVGLFFISNNGVFGYGILGSYIPTILEFSSGILVALPFALLWLVSHGRWMGLGDAKLALGLGWLLGFLGAFSAIVFAFWIGAVTGILLIFSKKSYGLKSEIPFAIYLFLGTLLVFFFSLSIF